MWSSQTRMPKQPNCRKSECPCVSAPACKRPIGFGEGDGEGDGETWPNMANHGQSWPIMADPMTGGARGGTEIAQHGSMCANEFLHARRC